MTPSEAWFSIAALSQRDLENCSDEVISLRLDHAVAEFPEQLLSHSAKYTLPEARKRPALAPKLVVLRLKGLI